ncbi:MAG: DUF421 domain-containing protein [Chitinophagaceae bacterium]
MSSYLHNNFIQIILRCIAVYFFVIMAIRIFGKKELAQLSVVDLVFILLISNSVQNAMVGPDTSLNGGLIAALSLFILNYLMKLLMYRNKKISEALQGKAKMLIYKGDVEHTNLKAAEITIDELFAAVREHGVERFNDVDLAMLEVDGNISVISNDFKSTSVQQLPTKRKHKLKGRIQ